MTSDEAAQVESFYTRTENALANEDLGVRSSLANEIGLWEAAHAADLDQDTVDQLDAAQDHLRNGMPTAEAPKSALAAGLKSWWNDPNKLDVKNLKDTVANALPGGWTPWLIGAGLILVLILAGQAAGGFREVRSVSRGA